MRGALHEVLLQQGVRLPFVGQSEHDESQGCRAHQDICCEQQWSQAM